MQLAPGQNRLMIARRWTALGCVVACVWLLAVGVVYVSWPAIAVALGSLMFGVYELRRPHHES